MSPSFVFSSSPSDNSSQPVIPSTSSATSELGFISLQYLPPWAASSEKDLATNAPSTSPPTSRSVTPRLMDTAHHHQSSGSNGEEKEPSMGANAWFAVPQFSLPEGETAIEHNQVFHGRPLHVNTLHQRAYHTDELSPLPYSSSSLSPGGLLQRSASQPPETMKEKDYLEAHEILLAPSPSKTKFLRTPASNRFEYLVPNFIKRRIRSMPDSPQVWLALYFTLNLTLTLYNKSVLIHFPFPYTLTALHALCGTIGTFILLRMDGGSSMLTGARALTGASSLSQTSMPNLNGRELIVLFLFSVLYTLNIVVSNASLRLVTVPFHQAVRASTPFFTIMFAAIILGRRCSKRKLLALIPVVVGVGFATYGDYYFTAFGFFLTLLGTMLAALKTILTNVILVKPTASTLPVTAETSHPTLPEDGPSNQSTFPPSFFSSLVALAVNHLVPPSPSSSPAYPVKPLSSNAPPLSALALPKISLSPIHLLYLMSPLAFIQTTLLAHFTGELDRVRWHLFTPATAATALGGSNGRMWLLLNGVLAFFLNVVSFNANRRVGPLGMSVAANVKQVLTVLCAVAIFDLTITPANGLGIALTLLGGALYATVEFREKQNKKSRVV